MLVAESIELMMIMVEEQHDPDLKSSHDEHITNSG